jgi:hypothetical protein
VINKKRSTLFSLKRGVGVDERRKNTYNHPPIPSRIIIITVYIEVIKIEYLLFLSI